MTADRPDIDLLADLDAGLLDEPRAREVHAAAMADPSSAAVLDALVSTRAELAAMPVPPIPPAAAARWAAALRQEALEQGAPGDAEQSPGADPLIPRAQPSGSRPTSAHPLSHAPPSHAPPSRRAPLRLPAPRRRPTPLRWRPRPAVLAAVLLIAVLVAVGLVRAQPPAATTVSGVELAAAGRAAIGVGDAGEFADPARRAACLRSVAPPGVAADPPLLGGRAVELDGRPGVLMVLGTGVRGSFDIVVVDPGCDALLAALRVGR